MIPGRARRAFPFAVVLAVLLATESASAQVNIESLRTDLQKTPAVAKVEGSFTGNTGNVESVEVGAAASGAVKIYRSGLFASSALDYARFAHVTTVSKSFIHFRYHYELFRWLYPEAFVQQQQDKFQRLQLREIAGLGPRFNIIADEEFQLSYGTAYMFEYERISVPAGATDPPTSSDQRWSNYLSSTWQPDSRIRLLATFYMQPRFDDFSDFRALFEAGLTMTITKHVAVKFAYTMRYDSQPPTDVKNLDTEEKSSFVLTF